MVQWKTSFSNTGGSGLIPGPGTKSPCASWPKDQNQNRKQKQYYNKFNKDLKKKKALIKSREHREPVLNGKTWLDMRLACCVSAVDLLCDSGLRAFLSEPWRPVCKLPALSFTPPCLQSLHGKRKEK